MLARLYERINNKRRDFLHKVSNYYASHYDLIFLERLRVANMARNHKLARKILDASWSTLNDMCKYKANRMVEVEPAYSSIDCSRYGLPVPKSLAVRTHVCPRCGAVLDRDYNSALNHLQNGMKLLRLPAERREFTPVEPQSEVIDGAGTRVCGDMQLTGETGGSNPVREASALEGLVVRRARMNSWPFHELKRHVEYKSAWEGVNVWTLTKGMTRGTSQRCPRCGKKLREAGRDDLFHRRQLWCPDCKVWIDRDVVAVMNIARKGATAFERTQGPAGEAMVQEPGSVTPVILKVDAGKLALRREPVS